MSTTPIEADKRAAEATCYGQPANRGEIIPMPLFPNEGYARLECGGTSVLLGYTLLNALLQNIEISGQATFFSDLCKTEKAIQSITCEAGLGNTPAKPEREAFESRIKTLSDIIRGRVEHSNHCHSRDGEDPTCSCGLYQILKGLD